MTETARVGEKGQAVIPKSVRDAAGIAPGDTLAFHVEDGKVIIEKAFRGHVVDEMRSLVPRKRKEPARIDWDAEYGDRFGAK
ncbi:MAG: Antidote-toxin recognition MazE, bacterial antitoxin [Thermoplasmata archaeon]|jgi:AbrB family looped-hinge helix DNA binding protein|nr:Antidote-toxin recognition MazE, bacterial antitoxin [Thermoplasmata archaeon]